MSTPWTSVTLEYGARSATVPRGASMVTHSRLGSSGASPAHQEGTAARGDAAVGELEGGRSDAAPPRLVTALPEGDRAAARVIRERADHLREPLVVRRAGCRKRVPAEVRPRVDVQGRRRAVPVDGRLDVVRCPGRAGSGPVHVHTGRRRLGEAVRAPGSRRAQRRSGREHEREGRLPVEQDRPRVVERRLRGPCGARERRHQGARREHSHECYPDPSSHRRHFRSP